MTPEPLVKRACVAEISDQGPEVVENESRLSSGSQATRGRYDHMVSIEHM